MPSNRFVRSVAFALLLLLSPTETGTTLAQFQLIESREPVNEAINFVYDPGDGAFWMLALGLEGVTTTSIKSANAMLDPTKVSLDLLPFPDQNTPSSFFKLSAPPDTLTEINFEPGYLPAGLSFDELQADLTVSGSLSPSGGWQDAPGGGPYLLNPPEPSSWLLACIALLGLLRFQRGRARS